MHLVLMFILKIQSYADNLEQSIEQMEEVIKRAAERNLQRLDVIPEVVKKNRVILQRKRLRHSRRQKEDSEPKSLSNLFEEFDVFDTTQWPVGVTYDNVRYLGDLSSFQFFSNKVYYSNSSNKWQDHTIKKFGNDVVLVADSEIVSDNVPFGRVRCFNQPKVNLFKNLKKKYV